MITIYYRGYKVVKQIIIYLITNYSRSWAVFEVLVPIPLIQSRPQVTPATGLPANSKDGAQSTGALRTPPLPTIQWGEDKEEDEEEEQFLPGLNMAPIVTPSARHLIRDLTAQTGLQIRSEVFSPLR